MTVRWGILGASNFALQHMGPAIHAARGAELVALATSDPSKAAPFLEFCPRLRVIEGYEALLADPEVDAVYIPLPNHLHVEWAIKALEAGKHVLCEKPLAMNAGDFDGVIRARDKAGKLAAEAFMIVHHSQWQFVRDRIAEGAIGELVHVSGAFSYDNRDLSNIRNRAEVGGGALPDIGVYVIGSARFATGAEIEGISARIRWEGGVDVFSEVQGRIGAATYSAYVSMRLQSYQEMVFHGDAGLIRLTAPFNANVFSMARVEMHRPGMKVVERRWPAENHYIRQVEAFGKSVETGEDYPCPLEFSRGTQVAMDAAFAAAQPL